MKRLAQLVSVISLVLVVVPCWLFLIGHMQPDSLKQTALIGTILWFTATPLWMSRKLPVDADQVEI